MTFRRKANRLPPASYEGGIYFVIISCDRRAAYFAQAKRAEWCAKHLLACAQMAGADLLAYTIMPDHVHLLVAQYHGTLPALVRTFKQVTGFHFKKDTGQGLWQKGYYDHVIRKEEDLAEIALYIAANPVRRALVVDWQAYEFTGGSLLARDAAPHPAPGNLKVAATLAAAHHSNEAPA